MTRFARAKGSKASNEKAPEDGTPWEVMKEQLKQAKQDSVESKKRQEAEKQRIENYENFLKEQKVLKRKASWCHFPEAKPTESTGQNVESNQKKQKKNKQTTVNVEIMPESAKTTSGGYNSSSGNIIVNDESKLKKNNKHKNNNKAVDHLSAENRHKDSSLKNNSNIQALLVKKTKSKKASQEQDSQANQTSVLSQVIELMASKKKKKSASISQNDTGEIETINTDKIANIHLNKRKQKNARGQLSNDNSTNTNENSKIAVANKQNKIKAIKKKKINLVDGQPVRRKEIDRGFQLIINGKEVELVRFDGFPIMKKDAERLTELKKNMMKKGIPKSEVQRTMKLERRRAEKALARVKRDVCYNCRKGGHNLSDCPDLKSKIPGVDGAEGVCFKCGSTEHRQFECKVQRDKEFRFATCFICREAGHIARQCPDNPKGLYPNGGCCKLCGDVTHLRKDCPAASNQKEETSVKLQTLDTIDNLEDISLQNNNLVIKDSMKKPKKIKF